MIGDYASTRFPQDSFCPVVGRIARDNGGEPDRRVDKKRQPERRLGLAVRRGLRTVFRRYSSQTASPSILSLSRAMLVGGPSSMRPKIEEISNSSFGSPRSL